VLHTRWKLVCLAATLLLSACSDDTSDPGNNTVTVNMQAAAFSPANVSVSVGQSVRWLNSQPIAHNITPDNPQQPGVWTAQNVPATQGFSFTALMNTAGVFDYSCTIHPGMTGRVTVQ
jgi:plastocyanin